MARLTRVVLPGQVHLILQRARHQQVAFVDPIDRTRYLADLRAAAADAAVAIHAYALIDQEVRLLVTPSATPALAGMMQSLGRRYVRGYNQRHGNSGTPWEGRFRSTVVQAPGQFMACLLFVERPAGPSPELPHWSSLRHHLGLVHDPVVTDHAAFWSLGNTPFEREATYRGLIDQPARPEEVATILRAASHGWALGSIEFSRMVHEITGRRQQPMRSGRPRKSGPLP